MALSSSCGLSEPHAQASFGDFIREILNKIIDFMTKQLVLMFIANFLGGGTTATLATTALGTVAANVAAAINNDATLSGLGISATTAENVVTTNGSVTATAINDPGLSHATGVPASSAWGLALLAALLLGTALWMVGHRRDAIV